MRCPALGRFMALRYRVLAARSRWAGCDTYPETLFDGNQRFGWAAVRRVTGNCPWPSYATTTGNGPSVVPTSRSSGPARSGCRCSSRAMAGVAGNRPNPRHSPLAPVPLEVICPPELNMHACEHLAVALHATDVREVREVREANPSPGRTRSRSAGNALVPTGRLGSGRRDGSVVEVGAELNSDPRRSARLWMKLEPRHCVVEGQGKQSYEVIVDSPAVLRVIRASRRGSASGPSRFTIGPRAQRLAHTRLRLVRQPCAVQARAREQPVSENIGPPRQRTTPRAPHTGSPVKTRRGPTSDSAQCRSSSGGPADRVHWNIPAGGGKLIVPSGMPDRRHGRDRGCQIESFPAGVSRSIV
jgi:hypothetical protein